MRVGARNNNNNNKFMLYLARHVFSGRNKIIFIIEWNPLFRADLLHARLEHLLAKH